MSTKPVDDFDLPDMTDEMFNELKTLQPEVNFESLQTVGLHLDPAEVRPFNSFQIEKHKPTFEESIIDLLIAVMFFITIWVMFKAWIWVIWS